MSGRYATAPGGTELGFYLPEETTTTEEKARSYIQEKWAAFLDLSRRMIDLQHRAALAKQAAERAGDIEREEAALTLIEDIGYLNQWHNEIVFRIEAIRENVGLGAIQLPLGVAVLSGLALLVAWAFRRYDAQELALKAIEDGTITPEQLIALTGEDAPGEIVGGLASALKWGAVALVGWVLLQGFRTFRPNPPLVVFHENPPGGEMSNDVVGVQYRHNDDGEFYEHRFDRSHFDGVHMDAEDDGSIRIFHPRKPVWDNFE